MRRTIYAFSIFMIGSFLTEFAWAQSWSLDQTFTNPNNLSGVLRFGQAVAIDGNTLVLGAPAENTSTGAAYVYEYDGSEWQFAVRLEGSGLTASDGFGTTVAVEGNVVVIGAPSADGSLTGSGAVYIWEMPISGWGAATVETIRLSTDLTQNGQFGSKVDIRGNELLISAQREKGAPSESHNNGAVYLYSKANSDGWDKASQTARFYFPSLTSRPSFGKSISLQDDYLVISGQTSVSFNQGVVYVFEEPVTGWVSSNVPTAEFAKSTWIGSDNFGTAVTASEDRIVISGYIFSTGGQAFVYNKPTAGWSASSLYTEDYSIVSPYPANTNDNFGNSLDLSADRLVIGSFFDNGATTVTSGRVYTYRLGTASATFEREFISPNPVNSGFYGTQVAISGTNIIIGTTETNEGVAYTYRGSYSETATDIFCFNSTYVFDNQIITTAGNYSGTFTASDGLDSLVALTLSQNPQLSFAFSFDPILCHGGTGGITFDSPSGGDGGPYEYSVDGVTFQSSPIFTGLLAGVKTLVIRDGEGCTRQESTSLQEPGELNITSSNVTNIDCNGAANGMIDLQVTGGRTAYYYSLDGTNYTYNGAGINTSVQITGLTPNTYTVYLKDANDCTISETGYTITQPAVLSFTADVVGTTCGGNNDGQIKNITSSGGNAPYSYSTDGVNFQSMNAFNGLVVGDYNVTVKDANSCLANGDYAVAIEDVIPPTVVVKPDFTLSLDATGYAGITQTMVNGGSFDNCGVGSISFDKTQFGCGDIGVNIVTMTVTDVNGNAASGTINITVDDNNPPYFTSATSTDFDENGTGAAYTAEATDCGVITYEIIGGADENLFSIDQVTGEITFLSAPDFENPLDAGADNTYQLDISAKDNENLSSILTILITLTDINESNVITWSGAVSSNWGLASNWLGGIVPLSTDNVLIQAGTPNTPEINGVFELNDLTITSGAILKVNAESGLKIGGSFIGGGEITAIRNPKGNGKYSIVGSPFINSTLSELNADYLYDYYDLDYFLPVGTMYSGKGYFVAFDNSSPQIQLSGKPNTGSIEVDIYDDGDGFNIIANPYLAAIDRASFVAANTGKIDGNIWLWDDGGANIGGNRGGDYLLINNVGTVSVVDLGDGVPGLQGIPSSSMPIGSFQGFLVKATTSDVAVFQPTMQIATAGSNDGNSFYRKVSEMPKMKLSLSSESQYGEVLIGLTEEATLGKDYAMDGPLFTANQTFSFHTFLSGEPFAIQALPLEENSEITVDLGMRIPDTGSYELNMESAENFDGIKAYLIDHELGTESLLKEAAALSMKLDEGEISQRFSLKLVASEVLSTNSQTDLSVFGSKDEMTIRANIEGDMEVAIYTLSGRMIFRDRQNFVNGQSVLHPKVKGGQLYILRLQNNTAIKFILHD